MAIGFGKICKSRNCLIPLDKNSSAIGVNRPFIWIKEIIYFKKRRALENKVRMSYVIEIWHPDDEGHFFDDQVNITWIN
jgi:hypothetical protein